MHIKELIKGLQEYYEEYGDVLVESRNSSGEFDYVYDIDASKGTTEKSKHILTVFIDS